MKKLILFAFAAFFSLSGFAVKPDSKTRLLNPPVTGTKENKMSEEEVNRLNLRGEEVSNNDNSKQTVIVQEGRRSRRGHDGMNRNNRRNSGVVFVGGGATLILIIILLIILV